MTQHPSNSSEFFRLMAIARLGLKVVPVMIRHDQGGLGEISMDADGFSFKSLESDYSFSVSWSEFDNTQTT